jgi:hypothetical protein
MASSAHDAALIKSTAYYLHVGPLVFKGGCCWCGFLPHIVFFTVRLVSSSATATSTVWGVRALGAGDLSPQRRSAVFAVVKAGPQLMTRMVSSSLARSRQSLFGAVAAYFRLQRQQMQSIPNSRPSPCQRKPRPRSVSIDAPAQGAGQLVLTPIRARDNTPRTRQRLLHLADCPGLIFPMDVAETVRQELIGVWR